MAKKDSSVSKYKRLPVFQMMMPAMLFCYLLMETYTTGTTIGATVQPGESVIEQPAVGGAGNDGWNEPVIDASVWYKFVAPNSGSVEIDMCGNGLAGTDYDSQVAVYSTSDCNDFNTYSFFGGNDDLVGCPSIFCLLPYRKFVLPPVIRSILLLMDGTQTKETSESL